MKPTPVSGHQHHRHCSFDLYEIIARVLAFCVAVVSGYEEGKKLSSEGSPVLFGLTVNHIGEELLLGLADAENGLQQIYKP